MEKKIESYLHERIPITQAMGITVVHASKDKIILSAPLDKNINDKQIAFGGSLHAVATLACWSLLYVNLNDSSNEVSQILIARSEASFQMPVDSDFNAECMLPEEHDWERFMKTLRSRGKARISLSAKIYHRNLLAVDYHADFAAIRKK